MFATVMTAAIVGMEVRPIQVEADVSDGMPTFLMVGYATSQVKEALDRVRTALHNSGVRLPPKRITVNLAPVNIRKSGAGFDLPVAASILAASGILSPGALTGVMMAGELSLSGEVRPVPGILPMVIEARQRGCRYCMIPYENCREAMLVQDMRVIGIRSIEEMIRYIRRPQEYEEHLEVSLEEEAEEILDFCDIHGQEGAKRAAEIAVSGFHNLLMIGPPGSGKTMLAKRIPTIMPNLTFEESLELTRIYSVAGLLGKGDPLVRERPFRSPHHTCSAQALTGGGYNPKPGDITLSHHGVLFLDEMPEFSRHALETLRQPMEDHRLILSRASGTYEFPASFMLVAAMNPCPCGFFPSMRCHCTPGEVNHYLGKISQPLLDRIDLCADIPAVTFEEISGKAETAESSVSIRRRVESARKRQLERFDGHSFSFNAQIPSSRIHEFCILTEEAQRRMSSAFERMQFSARAYHKILRTARTIADLAGDEKIHSECISEALSYRAMDKKYWR